MRALASACLLLTTVLGASFGLSEHCFAQQVQLPTVNLGFTNFEDGFGAPGWLIEVFPDYDHAGAFKDAQGNTVPGLNRLTAFSTTTHVAYISQRRFLGGWLSVEALLPWVALDVRTHGASSRVSGFADLTVGAGLQWDPKELGGGVFAGRFVFDVGVPTGQYDDRQPVNIGNNYALINPYYAFTFERRKVEVSARFHYLWNAINHEPFLASGVNTLQPGQAFHMNYSASYEVLPNVRIGLNGYWLQQLTDDRVNGVNVPHSLERTVGLGPGFQWHIGRNTWIHLNGYKEVDVRNRAEGSSVILRVSTVIPSSNAHL